jgi:hypothetical protein
MTMLTVVPKRWYSWDFEVVDGERQLAFMDLSSWIEKGVLSVDGVEHRVYREGMASGDFILERSGTVLARGTKPSAFRNTFIVSHHGREYTLRKKSAWGRAFVVIADGPGEAGSRIESEIGSLAPQSAWTRRATVDLPKDWPLAIRVFVIWLAVIIWKREANAGGGG